MNSTPIMTRSQVEQYKSDHIMTRSRTKSVSTLQLPQVRENVKNLTKSDRASKTSTARLRREPRLVIAFDVVVVDDVASAVVVEDVPSAIIVEDVPSVVVAEADMVVQTVAAADAAFAPLVVENEVVVVSNVPLACSLAKIKRATTPETRLSCSLRSIFEASAFYKRKSYDIQRKKLIRI